MQTPNKVLHALLMMLALAAGFLVVGCDNKETLLNVKTPDGELDVQRDEDSGEVTIDVNES